mgnify:CR=1 FL=1
MEQELLKNNFERHGFKTSFFDTKEAALAYLKDQISGKKVAIGGSVTAQEMGLYEALSEKNEVIWHWKKAGRETLMEARSAEVYITSANGVSKTGELVNIDGITLNIVDTAGIHDTEDIVEKIGVTKAMTTISDADLILYIVDGTCALNDDDYRIMDALQGKKVITLINKNDQNLVVDKLGITLKLETKILEISAKEGTGKDDLHDLLKSMFFNQELTYNDELYITNLRHKSLLYDTRESLNKVLESIDMGMGEDFFTIDLMSAYTSLGKIIGEELEDDLVNKIFAEFCMGK